MQAEEDPGSVSLLIHNRNLNRAEEGIKNKSKSKILPRSRLQEGVAAKRGRDTIVVGESVAGLS